MSTRRPSALVQELYQSARHVEEWTCFALVETGLAVGAPFELGGAAEVQRRAAPDRVVEAVGVAGQSLPRRHDQPRGRAQHGAGDGHERRNEIAVFLDAEQRRALLRGVFAGYDHAADTATVTFDTNRRWRARMSALAELFPQARVICCVREVPWIVDSIERQAHHNPFELLGLFGYEAGSTVYTRIARVAGSDGMVGYALDAFEACFGAHSERLILLDYEALARAPGPTMRELYRLLGERLFSHDFEDVAYEADAFGAALGAAGAAPGYRAGWSSGRGRACCLRSCSSGSPITASDASRSRGRPTCRRSSGAVLEAERAAAPPSVRLPGADSAYAASAMLRVRRRSRWRTDSRPTLAPRFEDRTQQP